MGECPPGLTIDRVDVNGPYAPENCRWASYHTQARNRTDNVWVEHDGGKLVLKDFAAVMDVNYKSLHRLVRYENMDPHDAARYLSPRK